MKIRKLLYLAVFYSSIASAQNVGINTSNPQARLHINGDVKIDGTNTLEWGAGLAKEENAGKIGYGVFTPSTLDIVGAGLTGTERKIKFWNEFYGLFNGSVGIGSVSSPNAALHMEPGNSNNILGLFNSSNAQATQVGIGNMNTGRWFNLFNTGAAFPGGGGRMLMNSGSGYNAQLATLLSFDHNNNNTGIGTTTPDPSAALDISVSNLGMLTPRMTMAQRDAIPNPKDGLVIFCTNAGGNGAGIYEVFAGGGWKDLSGNAFPGEVRLCGLVWMTQNLAVTHFANGDSIPLITDATEWANTTGPACCYFNNDPATYGYQGLLYNFAAVTDPRGLAPPGWRVATQYDYETLSPCLGLPENDMAHLLKSEKYADWMNDISNLSNETDQEMRYRNRSGLNFVSTWGRSASGTMSPPTFPQVQNFITTVWTSTPALFPANRGVSIVVASSSNNFMDYTTSDVRIGFPVRCVRN